MGYSDRQYDDRRTVRRELDAVEERLECATEELERRARQRVREGGERGLRRRAPLELHAAARLARDARRARRRRTLGDAHERPGGLDSAFAHRHTRVEARQLGAQVRDLQIGSESAEVAEEI